MTELKNLTWKTVYFHSSCVCVSSFSVVSEFLQLFTAQLLQSSSAAPAGLNLHVLELYTTELALVGSTQVTLGDFSSVKIIFSICPEY